MFFMYLSCRLVRFYLSIFIYLYLPFRTVDSELETNGITITYNYYGGRTVNKNALFPY
jgi:hypothetical protein